MKASTLSRVLAGQPNRSRRPAAHKKGVAMPRNTRSQLNARVLRILTALMFACGLAAHPAVAQTTTGVVLGTVRDAAGAVVPGVTVSMINAGTNARSETVSDVRGAFIVPQLPPGTYRLEASLQGFKRFVRSGIALQVQQQVRVDVVLEIGADGRDGERRRRRLRARHHHVVGRQGGGQRAHRGAAAEHAQHLQLDLPDARASPAASATRTTRWATRSTACAAA